MLSAASFAPMASAVALSAALTPRSPSSAQRGPSPQRTPPRSPATSTLVLESPRAPDIITHVLLQSGADLVSRQQKRTCNSTDLQSDEEESDEDDDASAAFVSNAKIDLAGTQTPRSPRAPDILSHLLLHQMDRCLQVLLQEEGGEGQGAAEVKLVVEEKRERTERDLMKDRCCALVNKEKAP